MRGFILGERAERKREKTEEGERKITWREERGERRE